MYLSQEFDSEVLDLVKKKYFIPINIILDLKTVKKNCQTKTSFIVH